MRMVEDLKRAYENQSLTKRMKVYSSTKLLVIDEVGYLPLDSLGSSLFFQLISNRYERGSIILTSNKGFGEWGELMGDPVLATAVLDRLLHHAHIINISIWGLIFNLEINFSNLTHDISRCDDLEGEFLAS